MHTNPGPCICVGGGLRGRDAKGKQRKRRTIQEEGERGIRKYLIIRRQQRYTHLHVCSHPADQKYMSFKYNILPTPETRCTRTRLSSEPFVLDIFEDTQILSSLSPSSRCYLSLLVITLATISLAIHSTNRRILKNFHVIDCKPVFLCFFFLSFFLSFFLFLNHFCLSLKLQNMFTMLFMHT